MWVIPRRRTLLFSLAGLTVLLAGLAAAAAYHLHSTLAQARTALAARDYEEASAAVQRYLAWRPSDTEARLLAARAARRLNRFDEAEEQLRRCRRNGGPTDRIELEFALIDVRRGEPALVRALRARAEQDAENGPEILEELTRFYLSHYLLQDARRCFDLYLEYRPDDLLALLGRAYVWERLQYYPDALRDYRRALAAHPDSERARRKLAESLLVSGTPAEARAEFARLAEAHPDDRDVRLGLARCDRRLARAGEAARRLDELLRERPDDGEALRERGQAALDLGDAAGAERWLSEAARRLPHDRETWHALATSLRRLGRPADAAQARADQLQADLTQLQKVSEAVMRSPNDPKLRYEGAMLFLRNGEREEGVRWLRMALRLDPDYRQARDALAGAGQAGWTGNEDTK